MAISLKYLIYRYKAICLSGLICVLFVGALPVASLSEDVAKEEEQKNYHNDDLDDQENQTLDEYKKSVLKQEEQLAEKIRAMTSKSELDQTYRQQQEKLNASGKRLVDLWAQMKRLRRDIEEAALDGEIAKRYGLEHQLSAAYLEVEQRRIEVTSQNKILATIDARLQQIQMSR